MKNKMTVETKMEEMKNRSWLYYEDDKGESVFISDDEPETITEAAKRWNISPEAVIGLSDSLNNAVECIVRTVIDDLKDVWEVAQCAHNNALTAMEILSEENEDCTDSDGEMDWNDCEGCDEKEGCSDYQNHLKDDLSNSRVN